MANETVVQQNSDYAIDGYQSGFEEQKNKAYFIDKFVISPLNLKSSVLCPENRRLTSQYLALEQINAHQKMISRTKGHVDTSTPKSMKSYLNYLEKKKKGNKRESIARKKPLQKFHDFVGLQCIEQEEGSDASPPTTFESLDKGIQTNVLPLSTSKVADKISWYLEAVRQGEFITTTVTSSFLDAGMNLSESQSSATNSFGLEKANKGDIMDWHSNVFTQNKWPFFPRILTRNNVRSKVLDMRCYNPPKKKFLKTATSNEALNKYENSSLISPAENNVHHNDWISDQAQRVLIRQKMKSKLANRECFYPTAVDSYSETPVERHSNCQNSFQMLTCDEESKYLNYLGEVTEDILRSGIYTDRAIKRAFEFHLQFHEKEADRVKLIQLLEQVLEDLHVDDCEDSFQRGSLITSAKSSSLCNSPPEKETLEQLINSSTYKAGVPNTSNDSVLENPGHFNLITTELNHLQEVPFGDGNDEQSKYLLPQMHQSQKHASVDSFAS